MSTIGPTNTVENAVLFLGGLAIVLTVLFLVVKFLFSAFAGHALVHMYSRWRQRRRARRWRQEQDEKKERTNRCVPPHRDPE